MTIKLRELIRQVRACKTAAEEREVIAKESSALRTAFKDDNPKRHRNVAKLMFIHMLGYPTHFGQMECLKLIAENGFVEKRIGYLGFMLLLDEKQELFMMVTNSIKNDLNNANQFIVGIALCAFANLCSTEMASDLASEVAKLLQNGNPYIRKKAALCCVRIVHKVPDLGESLLNSAIALLSDKHHGVLVAGLKLCIVLCQTSSSTALEHLKKQTANLVQILKNLLISEYRAEYDVCGIIDPFLQIEVLRLLRLVGKGDTDSSDIMSDILAQVMTNTDSSKIPGSAILYECVQTVMIIEATQGLRVLAVNILGCFLSNRDNNIRYVALNMLVKIMYMDLQAIQRHRATVMDCLKDPDVSIRRRALDLVYALANDNNVKSLTKDLLEYLEIADREIKGDLTAKICSVIQKFSSSKLWYINQMVNLILKAGEYISNESVFILIVIISNTPELQGYTVRLFYRMAECWSGQESLALATIWCIGEYGEMLINHGGELETEDPITVTELEVLDVLEMFAGDLQTSPTIKAFCLIALLKLSSRYLTCTEQIQEFISKYTDNSLLELQQRSVEFNALISKHQNIRNALVERIPVLNEIDYQGKRPDPAVAALGPTARVASPPPLSKSSSPKIDDKMDTLNFMNLFDFNCEKGVSKAAESNTLQDMLNVDSKAAKSLPTDSSSSTQTSRAQAGNVLDLLSMSMSATSLTDSKFAATNAQQDDSMMPTRFQKPAHKYGQSLSQGSHGLISSPEVQVKRKSLDLTQSTSYGKQMQVSSDADQYGEMSSASSLPGSFIPSLIVLQSSRLRVSFGFSKTVQSPQATFIHATYVNSSSDLCTDFMLEAAVPKFMQLRLEPASNNVLPPNASGTITQNLTVINSLHGQRPLMMRIRITYKVNGQEIIEQAQIENFPLGL